MEVFTLGLAHTSVQQTLTALYRPPTKAWVPGLVHAECLTPMELGVRIFSPKRMQLRKIVMFAAWESDEAVNHFLTTTSLGLSIAAGWHLRMGFLRRWGSVREFASLREEAEPAVLEDPVAAFTLARMRLPEIPRFIRWGRPVEAMVRDNPETTLSLAAIRYPRTIATFSIWKSTQAMVDMVRGNGPGAPPNVHLDAMKERTRREFHHEFTTLRFRLLSESGSWDGQSTYIPRE